MPRKYLDIPKVDQLPAPVYLRHDEFGADTHSAPHRHAWGQLNYTAHGVMHLDVDGQRFLSPPHYAVWVPPGTEHGCYNPQAIVYRSVYLDRSLCTELPQQPCSLVISDILKAILGDFARRDLKVAQSDRDQRLVQVLLDQLLLAPTQTCYLPFAHAGAVPAQHPVWDVKILVYTDLHHRAQGAEPRRPLHEDAANAVAGVGCVVQRARIRRYRATGKDENLQRRRHHQGAQG